MTPQDSWEAIVFQMHAAHYGHPYITRRLAEKSLDNWFEAIEIVLRNHIEHTWEGNYNG